MSYIVPALVALAAFFAWVVVISRMTNLHLKMRYRVLVFLWAALMMSAPITDLHREHHFESELDAVIAVVRITAFRMGNLVIALWVCRLLAMAYPDRMTLCPVEKSPVNTTAKVAVSTHPT